MWPLESTKSWNPLNASIFAPSMSLPSSPDSLCSSPSASSERNFEYSTPKSQDSTRRISKDPDSGSTNPVFQPNIRHKLIKSSNIWLPNIGFDSTNWEQWMTRQSNIRIFGFARVKIPFHCRPRRSWFDERVLRSAVVHKVSSKVLGALDVPAQIRKEDKKIERLIVTFSQLPSANHPSLADKIATNLTLTSDRYLPFEP